MNNKKEEAQKTCFVCERRGKEFDSQGKHNFISHIIDGEQRVVCVDCKIYLVFNKKARNGF